MGREAAVKEAVRLFKAADTDKNGSISFAEWCAAGINMKQSAQSNMELVFGKDRNLKLKKSYQLLHQAQQHFG